MVKISKYGQEGKLEKEHRVYRQLEGIHEVPAYYGAKTLATPHGSFAKCQENAFAMEFVGPSLDKVIRFCGGRVSSSCAALLASQLLKGLESIHRRGYIYGPMKPANILVPFNGAPLKLADLARAQPFKDQRGHIKNEEGFPRVPGQLC